MKRRGKGGGGRDRTPKIKGGHWETVRKAFFRIHIILGFNKQRAHYQLLSLLSLFLPHITVAVLQWQSLQL